MAYATYNNIQMIEIHGEDCVKYLQGQLTNDLHKLSKDNPLQLNALCNQKGRVIALFFSRFIAENHLVIALADNNAEQTLEHLKKYAIFSKVTFTPSNNYTLVFCSNTTEANYLYQHNIIDKNTHTENHNIETNIALENIFQQLPFIDIFNSEKFLPAELNLDHFQVISYNKGCFVGQEIIARMKYRGNLKKQLLSIVTESVLDKNEKLFEDNGKAIADIVNQVDKEGQSYLLAVFNKPIDKTPIVLQGDITAKIVA